MGHVFCFYMLGLPSWVGLHAVRRSTTKGFSKRRTAGAHAYPMYALSGKTAQGGSCGNEEKV